MPNKFGFICISEMQRTFKVCFKGSVNRAKNKEKQKKLRFFINFHQKILVVQEKVVPLHPQNRTREFSSKKHFGVWCNGNTADSGPAFPGSSPGTPTKKIAKSLKIST